MIMNLGNIIGKDIFKVAGLFVITKRELRAMAISLSIIQDFEKKGK